jgi:hypothetical protein
LVVGFAHATSPFLWSVGGTPPLLVNGTAATPGSRSDAIANGSFAYATGHNHVEAFRTDMGGPGAPASVWLWSVATDAQVLSLLAVPRAGAEFGAVLVATAASMSLRDMATGRLLWTVAAAVVPSVGGIPAIAAFPTISPVTAYVLVSPPIGFELELVAFDIVTGNVRFSLQNANYLPTAFNATANIAVVPGLNPLTFGPMVYGVNTVDGTIAWSVATQLYVTADATLAVAWKPRPAGPDDHVNSTLLFIDVATGAVAASARLLLQRSRFEYSGALMTTAGGKRQLVLANGHELAAIAVADATVLWAKTLPTTEVGACGIVGSALVPDTGAIIVHGCPTNVTNINGTLYGQSPFSVFNGADGELRWAINVTFDVSMGPNPRRYTLLPGGVVYAPQSDGFLMLSTVDATRRHVAVPMNLTPIASSLAIVAGGSRLPTLCGVTNGGQYVGVEGV